VQVLWSWLLELCDLDQVPTVEEAARALTRGGIEIEAMTNLGAGFRGVIVAEVVGKRPHPQADKLTLVDVITERGGAATQVVCGAPNVPAPGRKVLWAQPGAELPDAKNPGRFITLGAKAVKGIESPGMLCAEDELGLGDDHAGIIVLDDDDSTALGSPAQRALGLDDWLLEVNAPANRGDLLGHVGVARELVAMLRGKLVLPDADLSAYATGGNAKVEIAIASGEDCPRYVARVIDGLTVKPSPRRIAQRLRAVGVRPISNLVDVTNYVLFELGQPLHAFDAAKLTTGIVGVSPAGDGEKFTTLDNQERTLVKTDLMIRDGDRGIALAGVMGGADTEVTGGTTRVLLESASFKPLLVRRTARRLGLHSEASHRFERGVDPELASFASARACRLMCMVGGGKLIGEPIDAYPGKRDVPSITTRLPRVQMLTGVPLTETACRDSLERLGFTVALESQSELTVTPPSVRSDVVREVDVIEEILRVTGYEQVPSTLPLLRQAPPVREANRADLARSALAAAGVAEAITYGFQSLERVNALGLTATDRRAQPIIIRNPMSIDQAAMRTSLLPNLVAAIARNQSYGRGDVALFEVGSVFLRRGERVTEGAMHELADEPTWAAGVLAGHRPGQIGDGAAWDAFDAKALALETIRTVAGHVRVRVNPVNNVTYLHPGVAGELVLEREGRSSPSSSTSLGRVVVGWFGELHPDVRERLGVSGSVFAFEVELDKLPLAPPAQMRAIPRFPGSERDVSLLLAEELPASRIVDVIEAANEPLVTRIRLLEEYRDAKLGAGMKSMLWSIAYRSPERTLTDIEVDKAHETIVGRLVENLPAQRR
jgi:phenylalanyl-tRNA synthetase beta chain